jgi:hypothetical protein
MMPDALFLGKNIRAGPFVPEIVPETLWLWLTVRHGSHRP